MKRLSFSLDHPLKILLGEKTLTHRIITVPSDLKNFTPLWDQAKVVEDGLKLPMRNWMRVVYPTINPNYSPGELVAMTEAFYLNGTLTSARFMPADYSRATLRIISVTPRRIQEITHDESLLEGIKIPDCGNSEYDNLGDWTPRDAYSDLWDTINPKCPFASNPWAWRIEFNLEETRY